MAGTDARQPLLNGALPLAGLVLLVIGATGVPVALVLAWTALALAFIGWLAEADGLAVPRPGRVPIQSYGCWETPLAFGVCHAGRELLFSREETELGDWSNEYIVRERPLASGVDPRFELPVTESGSWSLRGRAPVGALQFEHHERVSYVTRRSLERALRTAGVPR
jgi:hypothetical protein